MRAWKNRVGGGDGVGGGGGGGGEGAGRMDFCVKRPAFYANPGQSRCHADEHCVIGAYSGSRDGTASMMQGAKFDAHKETR